MIDRLMTGLAAALIAAAAQAQELSPSLAQALQDENPRSLERALAETRMTKAERRLAEGLLSAMLNRDDDAEALLSASARDKKLSPDMRRQAAETLAGVRLRIGDFAGAATMLDAADEIEALDADERRARNFVAPLAAAPRIERAPLRPGHLAVTRDMAGLARAGALINGAEQEAVLDTGAAYSTIVESAAERLNLRFFDGAVSVGAAAVEDVPARVAIADALSLGDAAFENVLFIVLPDEALSFADGQYTIEAIIGFPVLSRLERLAFEADNAGETLSFAPSAAAARAGNLYLDGLSPVVLVKTEGADAPLRMVLDTGAAATNLSLEAVRTHPALAEKAESRSARYGGAGGAVEEKDSLAIPELTLDIAGAPVTVRNVLVLATGQASRRDGLLGQDVLRSGSGYVLDFKAMTLELLPSAASQE
ncbi:MAG: aspartyl protease family protein [Pseudomonadota bacterium]|nr:aspartyl protease family protein [Pseudomonadota bacterium]